MEISLTCILAGSVGNCLLHHRDPYSPRLLAKFKSAIGVAPLIPRARLIRKTRRLLLIRYLLFFCLHPRLHCRSQPCRNWLSLVFTHFDRGGHSSPVVARFALASLAGTTSAMLIVLTLGSFQAVQGIKVQQLGLLVGGLVAGSAAGCLPNAGARLRRRLAGVRNHQTAASFVAACLASAVGVSATGIGGGLSDNMGICLDHGASAGRSQCVLPGWVWGAFVMPGYHLPAI